jgi:hypothetical protein
MHIVRRRGWEIAERQVTPEHAVLNRSVAHSSPAEYTNIINVLTAKIQLHGPNQAVGATFGATNLTVQISRTARTRGGPLVPHS